MDLLTNLYSNTRRTSWTGWIPQSIFAQRWIKLSQSWGISISTVCLPRSKWTWFQFSHIQLASSQHKADYMDFENNSFVVGLHYHRQTDQFSIQCWHFLVFWSLVTYWGFEGCGYIETEKYDRNYTWQKHCNVSQFNQDLMGADWNQTFSVNSVNQQHIIFSRNFCEIL